MDNVTTGKLIAECRRSKHLTQQQLADLRGLSNKTISKWESGAGSPDISNLLEVAKVLDITVDELLNGERKSVQVNDAVNENNSAKPQVTTSQMITIVLILLGISIGSILGLLSYINGWLDLTPKS